MITLKAALIAASAIGTVAVGGGATWAMAGSHQEADLRPQGATAPAVEREVRDAVPGTPPTCLPAKPALPSAKIPETGAEKQVRKHLEQNPATRELPKADVPKTDLPGAGLPDADLPDAKVPDAKVPDAKLPDAKLPDARGKLPSDLPTCLPSTKELTKGTPATSPSARVPAKPGLPAVPRLDCGKLAPAVEVGGTVERTVLLAKGLRHVSTVPGSADLRKANICAVTQKWADKTGRWITVETLRTPAGMTQNQLRQALKLPKGGTPVTVPGGTAGSILPDRGGVLLFDADGRSLLVNGSPVLAGGLKDVTTALAQAG
ncbi:hypothetical protein [Actinomadura livida]|uniref:Uncharacterized protein n=1 Tax=Actinomadura livida TaxID=79909 RepID=A0A7W7IJJ6_9ACTN|nr:MULTISPECIES: hypothetical protein [Actinomadura]MBB4778272.1 hypothetical protein [Actinomadura catellatispora]GGU25756.1 hypothetical protein GCM10010208_58410 [Actinomadura livida]